MKLLIVTNNPDRASFKQRIEIHIASLENRGIACEVAVLPSGSLDRRKLFRLSSEFSAVFLHKKRLNWLDTHWLRGYAGKIIYDFDDAIMYDDRRPEHVSYKRQNDFARTVKLADAVIAGNRYLAEHAVKFQKAVEILPTGLKGPHALCH